MAPRATASATFHDALLETLGRIDRPGTVCTSGDLPLTMPGLEVDGLGTIRLPLGKTQARKLIRQCSQAPYGKGTETVVDTNVRRVWELDPAKFELTNPTWEATVSSITADVQAALGLGNRKLAAHLYKLLLYDKGSFFLPHRDGEKLDGMVATLVISLPSPHRGGELVVSHEGQQHEIAFDGAAAGHELSYAAFYADCEHEVHPLREGYRLSLVYNLALARSRRKKPIEAPRTAEVVSAIAALLEDWPSDDVPKVAVTLEHQYSADGLNIGTLKGVDRARADVLFQAAEQAECEANLALVTHWQNGQAEAGEYEYGYGRGYGSRWAYDDEDEEYEEDDSDGTGHEMGEVYDESLSVSHWSDRDGKRVAMGCIDLNENEIVSGQPLEDWQLSREEFEGFTGNAGMTLDRWYHRAGVVIWPKLHHFHVLCGAGTDSAIGGLEAMVKKLKRARKSDREAQRDSCRQFAAAIIDTWEPRQYRYSFYGLDREEDVDRSVFPLLLQQLDAPELIREFLSQGMPEESAIELDASFAKFCKQHGWATFEDSLLAVFAESSSNTIVRNAGLLQLLCLQRDKNQDRLALCRRLADQAVAALQASDSSSPRRAWEIDRLDGFDDARGVSRPGRSRVLAALVKSLVAVQAVKPLDRLLGYTLAESKTYDLTDVHVNAIFSLDRWLNRKLGAAKDAILAWLASCRAELEQRTAEAPAPPADFRRPSELSCRCSDCRELSRFLDDPDESVHEFSVAKQRRRHLHQEIDRQRCDVTHVTRRTGRPYTLVCKKTTTSYEKSREIYRRDKANLKRLQAIEKRVSKAAE